MKKKVKLFSTIASLCLAVALMAFGVMAATTATLGITSTVSFTVSDVIADIEGHAFLDPVATKGTTEATVTGEGAAANYTFATYTTTAAGTVAKAGNPDDWKIGDIAFTSEKDCVVYTLKITNKAKSGKFSVTVSALPTVVEGKTTVKMEAAKGEAAAAVVADVTNPVATLETEQSVVITVTVTLVNKAENFKEQAAWNPTVTLANVAE